MWLYFIARPNPILFFPGAHFVLGAWPLCFLERYYKAQFKGLCGDCENTEVLYVLYAALMMVFIWPSSVRGSSLWHSRLCDIRLIIGACTSFVIISCHCCPSFWSNMAFILGIVVSSRPFLCSAMPWILALLFLDNHMLVNFKGSLSSKWCQSSFAGQSLRPFQSS